MMVYGMGRYLCQTDLKLLLLLKSYHQVVVECCLLQFLSAFGCTEDSCFSVFRFWKRKGISTSIVELLMVKGLPSQQRTLLDTFPIAIVNLQEEDNLSTKDKSVLYLEVPL